MGTSSNSYYWCYHFRRRDSMGGQTYFPISAEGLYSAFMRRVKDSNYGESICYLAKCFSGKSVTLTLTLSAMEGEFRRENVAEENQVNEEEGNEVGFEVIDDDLPPPEIRLAEDAALRHPIVTNLGTGANPIEVGDLPVHGFQFEAILLTCPPLQEEED